MVNYVTTFIAGLALGLIVAAVAVLLVLRRRKEVQGKEGRYLDEINDLRAQLAALHAELAATRGRAGET